MNWIDLRGEMSKEEILEIVKEPKQSSIPEDNVMFDKKRIVKLIHRIDPSQKPKRKKNENPQDGEIRNFISEEERIKYVEEFGPYGMALINDYEREYFKKRRDDILNSDEFEIDPNLDLNIVMMVIMDEIIQQRFLEQMSIAPTNKTLNQQITEVQKRYRENMKILDATREQRNAVGDKDKLDSLASAVMLLHQNKEQRMRELEEYKKEEDELLKKIANKAPPELDYFNKDEIIVDVDEDE